MTCIRCGKYMMVCDVGVAQIGACHCGKMAVILFVDGVGL
jgi:hypothetical protein